jgi:hypothetical protein
LFHKICRFNEKYWNENKRNKKWIFFLLMVGWVRKLRFGFSNSVLENFPIGIRKKKNLTKEI